LSDTNYIDLLILRCHASRSEIEEKSNPFLFLVFGSFSLQHRSTHYALIMLPFFSVTVQKSPFQWLYMLKSCPHIRSCVYGSNSAPRQQTARPGFDDHACAPRSSCLPAHKADWRECSFILLKRCCKWNPARTCLPAVPLHAKRPCTWLEERCRFSCSNMDSHLLTKKKKNTHRNLKACLEY
jgi:hypothetical protein